MSTFQFEKVFILEVKNNTIKKKKEMKKIEIKKDITKYFKDIKGTINTCELDTRYTTVNEFKEELGDAWKEHYT